jgi:signal peptidase I
MDWKSLFGHRVFKLVSVGTFVASTFLLQPYRPMVFVGQSMSPTYQNKEFALATTDTSNLKRGDVVVLELPQGSIVKRIAYMPGDWIDYYYFRGEWVLGKNINIKKFKHPERFKNKRVRVPEGYVYVLGDNRPVSVDSRQMGVLPMSWIREKLVSPKARVLDTQANTFTDTSSL